MSGVFRICLSNKSIHIPVCMPWYYRILETKCPSTKCGWRIAQKPTIDFLNTQVSKKT